MVEMMDFDATRQIMEKSPMENKNRVVMIGAGSQQKYFEHRDDTEVWGLNAIRPKWVKRWDRMFNLHTYENLTRYKWPVEIEQKWSEDNPDTPFYVMPPWPRGSLVNGIDFPRAAMGKAMPRGDYHCGSFDWMVAVAVFWGFEEIELHGVSLLTSDEPISARPCLEYWCGYAEGRGIKVVAAKDCFIFKFMYTMISDLIYGIDDTPLFKRETTDADEAAMYTWENMEVEDAGDDRDRKVKERAE